MDSPPPFETLVEGAVHHELALNTNPYITLETLVLRLIRRIAERTRIPVPGGSEHEKTILFRDFHATILDAYCGTFRSAMSHDERGCVERVLSKDAPHPSELLRFACCWYKYNALAACKLFAVDGLLGPHPKAYVNEAFSVPFRPHNEAVRDLYAYVPNVDTLKEVVERALGLVPNEDDPGPDVAQCIALYAEKVGEEEMNWIAAERRIKLQQLQQQAPKRKKSAPST